MRTHILIPAFNEAASLPILLRRIRFRRSQEIMVIDDGSQDETGKIAKRFGARVVRLPTNTGAGYATCMGLHKITVRTTDIVVLMDADGQHDPVYLSKLAQAIRHGADLVIASRYAKNTPATTSPLRIFGSHVISLWIWIWFGKRIHDPTSGYRAMNQKTYKILLQDYPTFFSEPEVVLRALQHGLVIREISCVLKPRLYGKSSISLLKACALITYILLDIPRRSIRRMG